ncbi:MFS transporter [Candidatus Nitrososphaera gargensis]|uniref:MFS transporter n=1 Tax=Candidatus Nitrososphaera gargensis TaxID=497727 RepID=UPI0011E56439|nr:MFS transporter [Candidatus Nitrososphaera gargensis]
MSRLDVLIDDLAKRIDGLKGIPLASSAIFAISFSSFFAFYDITNYAYIAPVLKSTFSVGDNEIAVGASTTVIGYVIGAFVITVFADSNGRRPALIASTLILGIGSLLAAFSQDMVQMSIFRLLTGIGIGSEIAVASAYIGEMSPKSKRGKYTSIVIVLGWVGLASSGPISLMLIQQGNNVAGIDGWRAVLAIPSIAAFLSLLFRIRMPESPRWLLSKNRLGETNTVLASLNIRPLERKHDYAATTFAKNNHRRKNRWHHLLKNRTIATRIALLIAVWVCIFVPVYASLLLVVEYINQGYSLTDSISINIISGIGFVVGGILSIFISERLERKYQILIASIIMAIGFILRGILIHDYAGLVIAGFIAFGANAWLVSSLYAYTAEVFPTRIRTFGFGIIEGSSRAISSIGPFIFVLLSPFGFLNTMVAISLFCFGAATIILIGPHTRGRSLESLN